jgi:hypothetical protein
MRTPINRQIATFRYHLLVATILLIILHPAKADENSGSQNAHSSKSSNVLLRGHLKSANTELTKFGIDCEKTGDKEWPLRVVDVNLASKAGVRAGDFIKEPIKSREGTTVLIKRAERIYRGVLEKAPPEAAASPYSSLPVALDGRSWATDDDHTGCEALEDEIFKDRPLGERWRQWGESIIRTVSRRCGNKTDLYSKGIVFRILYDKKKIFIQHNSLPKDDVPLIYRDIATILLNRPAGSKLKTVLISIYFIDYKPVVPKPEDDSGHPYFGHTNFDLPRSDPSSRIGDTGIPYCSSKGRRLCYGGVSIAHLPGALKEKSKVQ